MSGSYKKDKEWSHPLKVVSSYQVKELRKVTYNALEREWCNSNLKSEKDSETLKSQGRSSDMLNRKTIEVWIGKNGEKNIRGQFQLVSKDPQSWVHN